jgi:hypothetical protein
VLPQEDWKAAVRSYAQAVHDVLLANPMSATVLFEIPLSGPLELIEHLIETLVQAGFDAGTAARALELVGDATLAQSRREIVAREFGDYPTSDARALVGHDPDRKFVQLRALLADPAATPDQSFAIDLIIAGLENLNTPDA